MFKVLGEIGFFGFIQADEDNSFSFIERLQILVYVAAL
jgi:hypothetical protein